MKATRFFQTALLIIGLGSLLACGEDEIQDTDLILGRWDIQEALRSGRPTESLDNLFFEFFEEGKMRTNITGSTVDGSYEIDGDQLQQRGGPLETNYTIQSLTDSMLVLSAMINKFDFKLQFTRTVQEE
ncbi:hypothetical protein [Flavilitoribacter nigricans]|uniref:Lipocalin-like domain-containing protein n=1 Tax=Flavilitoribacter nigricans (strain ATCC 23147 / DSM 23189 / NBRC 102662 / NCIMB 1420 / SS-2) TaxID=1122177 RepID=A0A2D0MZ39_FLAN2|nr:hypothetical protein [Flavilitoribacter nigricans]PHN01440.1 hypothetical protein CRP01_37275 [Flavilitoribacter nigricans DSM 23189 = NBRC 102662]